MGVEYGNQFEPVPPNSIRDDIRRLGDDEFSCACNPPRSSHVRLSSKKFDRLEDSLSHKCRVLLRVFGDVISQ